jgi:formate/nitrite transporter FocA (FNT family)
MKTRKLFVTGLLLILFGLAAQFTALSYGFRAYDLRRMAEKTPAEAVHLRADSKAQDSLAYVALYTGIACTVLSLVAVILSYRASEPAPKFVIVVLMLVYGVLFLPLG